MPSVLNTLEDLFNDFSTSFTPNSGKDVLIASYPTVFPRDLEPVSIIKPGVNGPWIAGGAGLRWYQGLPVGDSDIDVFCSSKEQAQSVINEVRSWGRFSNKFTSDNATTLDYYAKDTSQGVQNWTIQIITKRYYNNMQEIIDNFDLSVCQVATDGKSWALGRHTAKDIRERNLRMEMPLMPDALKRLVKYWTYGYRPVDGLVEAVQSNPVGRWEFSPEEDYK
jgi:hypothetical protein